MIVVNLDKYKEKGLTGLANLGNTCYINSCMQILSHCYILNELIDKINLDKLNKTEDSILLIEWKNLKDLMWSKNCIVSPNRYVNTIQKISINKNIELFSGFAQNDLPEFLIFVIDCFHNSLKRKVEMNIVGSALNETDNLAKECYNMIKSMYSETFSELLSLFYGIHVSQLHSSDKSELLSVKPESFSLINLPLPENTNQCTIMDCFDLYTKSEYLEGDNAWYNDKKKAKENVYKSICFWSLPEILIVDFKRFTNQNKKINTVVSTPLLDLDLSKYVVGYDKEKFKYDLFGICNHSGGCLGGHYTAFVKNANNKWYHFNDTQINEINEDGLISNKGYCYFYKKQR
jgi:ubiquitin carboxyl-terminal hydrolase 8